MRIWIVLVALVAALSVCDATFGFTKYIFKQDAPEAPKERPHGVWKKKMVWKPRWIREWKEAKVWKPIWKKVWDPVWIQEWVTLPKPHPKKNGADGVDLTSTQPSSGPGNQPGPDYLAPNSGDGNGYPAPDFGQGNGGNGGGYLPPDPNPPTPGNGYGNGGGGYLPPDPNPPTPGNGYGNGGGGYLPPDPNPPTPGNGYGPPAPTPGNGYGPPGPTAGNGYGPPDPPPSNSYGPPQPAPGNNYGPPDFSKSHQGTVYLAPDYSSPAGPSQGQFGSGGSYLPPGNPPTPPSTSYGPPSGPPTPGNGYLPPPEGHNRKSDGPKEDDFRPSQPLPDLSGFQPIVDAILNSS